jgi:hypothetical protein
MAELEVVDLSGQPPRRRTTASITTSHGETLDLEPLTAAHPQGPKLTIITATGDTASAVIDPTAWATLRGYLAAET